MDRQQMSGKSRARIILPRVEELLNLRRALFLTRNAPVLYPISQKIRLQLAREEELLDSGEKRPGQ